MPLFNSATPFDTDVEKATNEMNTAEDWSLILDICERVTRQTNGSKDCLKSIVKRLHHRVPFVSMQALVLLDACVNNCGRAFHLEICSSYFVSECRTLISQKAHPKVAQKLKALIKTWAESVEFRDEPSLNLIPSFYDSLKKEGHEFTDGEPPKKSSSDPSQAKKEEDDIAKAIALSLQESDSKGGAKAGPGSASASLYPSYNMASSGGAVASQQQQQTYSKPVQKEIRKVRSLYDFEAAEDNELTFKAGELICVLDDSDPNWWKGSNHRGEGLFPANFVTADLTVEPEPEVKAEKKSVQFSEEVQVKTLTSPMEEPEIDEAKIDEVLALIQNADPTGETHPDSEHMLALEEQCKSMGPLIDTELEKIDRKHAKLVELNKQVMSALQMYHSLMKETPAYGYQAMKQPPPAPSMYGAPTQGASMYPSGQPQYSPLPPASMTQAMAMAAAAAAASTPAPAGPAYTSTSSQQSFPPTQQPPAMNANNGAAGYPVTVATNGLPQQVAVTQLPPQQQQFSAGPPPSNYNPGGPPPSAMYNTAPLL